MDDPVRGALQQICDAEGNGWQIAHYVIAVGLERMDSDDSTTTAFWVVAQKGQADYITGGLLDEATSVRCGVAED